MRFAVVQSSLNQQSGKARSIPTGHGAASLSGSLGVPIVGISGLPHGEALARTIDAAAFFAKPIDLEPFLESVRGLAERHARGARRAAEEA